MSAPPGQALLHLQTTQNTSKTATCSSPLLSSPLHSTSSHPSKTVIDRPCSDSKAHTVQKSSNYHLMSSPISVPTPRETQCLLAISSPRILQRLHYIISLSSPRSLHKLQSPSHRPIMGFENADWQTACRPGISKAFLEHIMVEYQ
jgi:hypothetical protein